MSANATPHIRLRTTLSHPNDPAIVLGFNARDTRYGKDSLVLKAEEIPNIRENPAVTHFVVPEKQADEVLDSADKRLYILGENFVYHVPFTVLEQSTVHTGDVRGETVTGRKVSVDDLEEWVRDSVEVGN